MRSRLSDMTSSQTCAEEKSSGVENDIGSNFIELPLKWTELQQTICNSAKRRKKTETKNDSLGLLRNSQQLYSLTVVFTKREVRLQTKELMLL